MYTVKISDPNGVYSTSYFVLTSGGEVYADNENIGFFKHPTITTSKALWDHLIAMQDQGFHVDIYH